MDSFKKLGVVPVQKLRVSADRSAKDVGDVAVQPGLRLMGRVVP
jgi:hypothetical protein